MPVYHFTFHAFGTWLPDRPVGYTPHGEGWKPPSSDSAIQYRRNMQQQAVCFDATAQQYLIDEAVRAQSFQRVQMYAVATDSTHVHLVVAWTDDREPLAIRSQLKSSLTRALNRGFEKRRWFVSKAGSTPVEDEEHLHHLVHDYLPKHERYWYFRSIPSDG